MSALGVVYTSLSAIHASASERAAGIVLAVLGAVLVAWASTPALRLRRLRRAAASTTGQVIECRHVDDRGGAKLWAPVVCFDGGGGPVTFVGQGRGNRARWVVGETVEVLYDPADPAAAWTVDVGTVRWVLGAVGSLVFVLGLVLAVR